MKILFTLIYLLALVIDLWLTRWLYIYEMKQTGCKNVYDSFYTKAILCSFVPLVNILYLLIAVYSIVKATSETVSDEKSSSIVKKFLFIKD